jgi:AcrR family transcriptional regulator
MGSAGGFVAVTGTRTPLNRARILRAALAYVDEHGLDALSMHKLGAELGVKGMSLYNHVDGKEGLLDGILEAMWAEVGIPEEAGSWRQDVRTFAQALRSMIHRHPEAARLVMNRQILPTAALEFFNTYLRRLEAGGLPQDRAAELVRTVIAHAFGFAFFELTWGENQAPSVEPDDGLRSFQHASSIVPKNTPEHLLRTAIVLCTRCDMDGQFNSAIDLMLRGMEPAEEPGPAAD